MDQIDLRKLWGELSTEVSRASTRGLRKISKSGAFASWNAAQHSREILIPTDNTWSNGGMPDWNGMAFSLAEIDASDPSVYVILELLDEELEVPFSCFCTDLLESIEAVPLKHRAKAFGEVINIWDLFFRQPGGTTLTRHQQRGLYAELWWLRNLLHTGIVGIDAVASWKGPEGDSHDFDNGGAVVEVKSTITKEPRKVRINNERQLDDHELESLHLFVLTLNVQEAGESLGDIVKEVRALLDKAAGARSRFDSKLVLAGYLDSDEKKYESRYKIRFAELFVVEAGFPRLLKLPEGVGDLSYSVQISACKKFERDLEEHLKD